MGFPGSSASKESAGNARDPSLISGLGRSPGAGIFQYCWASLVAQMINNLPAMWETWVRSLVGNIPWRRSWQSTPVFLSGESPCLIWRILVDFSPWGHKQSNMTDRLSTAQHRTFCICLTLLLFSHSANSDSLQSH